MMALFHPSEKSHLSKQSFFVARSSGEAASVISRVRLMKFADKLVKANRCPANIPLESDFLRLIGQQTVKHSGESSAKIATT